MLPFPRQQKMPSRKPAPKKQPEKRARSPTEDHEFEERLVEKLMARMQNLIPGQPTSRIALLERAVDNGLSEAQETTRPATQVEQDFMMTEQMWIQDPHAFEKLRHE